MCFFDSPIARCEAVHELVLTDETQVECAREHHCPAGTRCPLDGYFTETSGMVETTVALAPMRFSREDPQPAPVIGANSAALREPNGFRISGRADAGRQFAPAC